MANVVRFQSAPRIAERYAVTIPNIGLSEQRSCQRAEQLGRICHGRDVHHNLRQERDDVFEVAVEHVTAASITPMDSVAINVSGISSTSQVFPSSAQSGNRATQPHR